MTCCGKGPYDDDGADMEDYNREAAEESCDHVNEREIAGGFIECDDCGRMVPA